MQCSDRSRKVANTHMHGNFSAVFTPLPELNPAVENQSVPITRGMGKKLIERGKLV